ncbi:alpha/beta hydrolase [Microbacterium marinilacus]|uniref:Alpha/beta hydrolase n=1 Tax=Microbacterium marinilacus TaxID=415209 RepID=A0ABP7BI51_9MICO|nr:alpha/beta hydrolase [Microbacterium marinilacus]MBY0687683.1 alpha/beta hydrolase [Microbacterium marinilacus]
MSGRNGTILVLPGGGYQLHAPHEAEPVAAWLEGLGWHARVVRYPVGVAHPAPLDAVRAAIAAEKATGEGPVGVIGFSAGGHLAGHAALAPDSAPDERADFAILAYPVVSMVSDPHPRSRAVLLGEDVGDEDATAVSLESLVRPDSPPVFVWHTTGDPVVPASHSLLLARALADAGVAHELHLFPGEVHGVGLAEDDPAAGWTAHAARWLEERAAPLLPERAQGVSVPDWSV